MKNFTFLILLVFTFSSLSSCGIRENNNTKERKEKDMNTSINTSYIGDTLIGKFNGVDIDTLISEPIETTDRPSYNWRVYTKKGTVKDIILENQTIDVRFIGEGDLDGNCTTDYGEPFPIDVVKESTYYTQDISFFWRGGGRAGSGRDMRLKI